MSISGGDFLKDKTYDKTIVGERVSKARDMRCLTQKQVAEMIGVNAVHISEIERGATGMSIDTVVALCDALNVTSDYILFGEVSSKDSNIDKLLSSLTQKEKLHIEECLQSYIRHIKE